MADLPKYNRTMKCPDCKKTVYINDDRPMAWHDIGVDCWWSPF